MYKVLLFVRDERSYRELQKTLSRDGYAFSPFDDLENLADFISNRHFDLVLIDLEHPEVSDNIELLKEQLSELKRKRNLPVFALVGANSLSRLTAIPQFNDFLVKPVNPFELDARIRRIAKSPGISKEKDVMKSGDLIIDLDQCEVSVAGRPVELTFKEYELLKFLVKNKARVFTREQLLNELWGYDYYGGDRTVDVHIRRLRGKIEDADHTFIDTVRNIGYKFHPGK
jgi:two-component system, OmpR family, alkaline phosphatase synthesis response regulator PhoP